MKAHRSTQLFLYCSGGKSSVKYVRPALETEESKEEQGGVVRFLVAEGAGTHEIHSLMSDVYGEHCMSRQTCTNGRTDSAKDAHRCKTIRARDRPVSHYD